METNDGKTAERRRMVLQNSVVEVLTYGATQALRLGSNLILTRLLFPEAFGLMVVVGIVLFGLTMLSDVGILQAVIQNPRGDDEDFLNTAWTLQIMRGGLLCVLTWCIAYPASLFFDKPELFGLLLAAGGQLVIAGFESTSLLTLRRQVASRKLAVIEIGVQFATFVAVVATAMVWQSVWALLIGASIGGLVRLIWSHLIDVGYRNRLEWDKSAWQEITKFGRWIFGSSVATFLSSQSDRLLLGRLLGMSTLGVYSVALMLSEVVGAAVSRVVSGVLYPVFSRVSQEEPEMLRDEYYAARLRLDAAALPALGALTMLGDFIVILLWDLRYVEAGWMLRVLAIRAAFACIMLPCEVCLVATGESRFGFIRSVVRMFAVLIGVPLGYAWGGAEGLVLAVALSEVPAAFILWPAAARRGLFKITREIRAFVFFGLGVMLASYIRYLATGEWI
ncbi:MAG: oligosaccharide flippase family protein [Myxococcota bacterium]